MLEDTGVEADRDVAEVKSSPIITEWCCDTASDAVKALRLVVCDLKLWYVW